MTRKILLNFASRNKVLCPWVETISTTNYGESAASPFQLFSSPDVVFQRRNLLLQFNVHVEEAE